MMPAAAWVAAATTILGLQQWRPFKGAAASPSPWCGQESKAWHSGIVTGGLGGQEEAAPGQEDGFCSKSCIFLI